MRDYTGQLTMVKPYGLIVGRTVIAAGNSLESKPGP